LNAERERSGDLLVELTTTRSTLEQSSRLQALLESDHQSLQELRDQLRRFAADAERLCSGMIERQQGSLARLEDVADPTF
jgi:TolA-binding protein